MLESRPAAHGEDISDSDMETETASFRAWKLVEELDSKLSFAETNQKRKKLTFETFRTDSDEIPHRCKTVGATIAPINKAVNLLLRRSAVISKLTECPPTDRDELRRLEAEHLVIAWVHCYSTASRIPPAL